MDLEKALRPGSQCVLPQEAAALQEDLIGARASAASAQAAARLAERQAMRTRSERKAQAQAADTVQVRPRSSTRVLVSLELEFAGTLAPVVTCGLLSHSRLQVLALVLPTELCKTGGA